MLLRSALTGLLATIMLCVFSAASTCALSCEISGLQSPRHTVQHNHSVALDDTVPDHCGHITVPQSKSDLDVASHAVHLEQQCDGKLCTHDQVGTLTNGLYQHDQQTALIRGTITVSAVRVDVRLPNFGISDLLPNPPPRYSDVLRL